MRATVLACAGLCLLSMVAVAGGDRQAAAAAPQAKLGLPSADEVLASYRKAIGGDAAIKEQTSRHITGRFEMPAQGMSGPFELVAAAPDRMRMRIELEGLGEILRGYDGRIGWSVDPAVGPRLLQGRELDEVKHTADFYYDARRAGGDLQMTVLERAPFEGRECYALRVVRPSGFELTEYYDVKTGLMAGVRLNATSPMGTVPTVTVLREYKPFGKLQMPTLMHQTAMGVETVLRITDVRYDTVAPDAFALPPAIQALVK